MKAKPIKKSDVMVVFEDANQGIIKLFASPEALSDFCVFGEIKKAFDGANLLQVDARYDFAEVLEYIKTWKMEAQNE